MEIEFHDVRDKLPKHDQIVLFVIASYGNFYILHGIFKINEIHDFWVFESFYGDTTGYGKGSVFKWALAPEFSIVIWEYPEGKPVPLKYCRAQYAKFEDRFFEHSKFTMNKLGNFPINLESPEFPTQDKLDEAKERMLVTRFCICGDKATWPIQKTKTIPIDYPISYIQWLCYKCKEEHQNE